MTILCVNTKYRCPEISRDSERFHNLVVGTSVSVLGLEGAEIGVEIQISCRVGHTFLPVRCSSFALSQRLNRVIIFVLVEPLDYMPASKPTALKVCDLVLNLLLGVLSSQ